MKSRCGFKGTWQNPDAYSPTYILINQQTMEQNSDRGTKLPPLVLRRGKQKKTCHELIINRPCRLVYIADGEAPENGSLHIEFDPSVSVVSKTVETDE